VVLVPVQSWYDCPSHTHITLKYTTQHVRVKGTAAVSADFFPESRFPDFLNSADFFPSPPPFEMLQPVRTRGGATAPPQLSPTIYLSAQPALPIVIASEPPRRAFSSPVRHRDGDGDGTTMPVSSPELVLSPSLLNASPELSTVLPLEEEEEEESDHDVTTSNRGTAAATTNWNPIGGSFSFSQLLSSLQDYGNSNRGDQCGGSDEQQHSAVAVAYGGDGDVVNIDNNDDPEFIVLDLRSCVEPELEYVVFECGCHSTVHFWRPPRGSNGRPVRCYGPCGRTLAIPGSIPGTLRLQRTNLFYHYQYRQTKKNKKYVSDFFNPRICNIKKVCILREVKK
jgi:hypothetical protein